MTTEEAKILHGLYFDREMVDEEMIYTGSEILWLAKHSFAEGKQWRKDGKVQSLDKTQQDKTTAFVAVTAEQIRPIRYLSRQGSIDYRQKSNMIFIQLTAQGADHARRLDTRFGRLDLWYQGRKDGLIGILITIIVALVTTLITNRVAHSESHPASPYSIDWELQYLL